MYHESFCGNKNLKKKSRNAWCITACTARIYLDEPKLLDREPLRDCEYDGKFTFTIPFLILGQVTLDEHVNALER